MRDLAAERFCYVTTSGRVTGNPHTIEIWYAASERTLYILMGGGERSDTARNVRATAAVSVRLGGETWAASARIVEDADEAARARTLVPRKYAHEEEGLEEWAQTALPIAIDLP